MLARLRPDEDGGPEVGTRLNGAYVSSDWPLLAEIALAGRFAEVDEVLFLRRWPGGDGRPRTATASTREIAEWFEPGLGQRVPLHQTRVFLGYLQAVLDAPLGLRDRGRCLAAVIASLGQDRRWRMILGELRLDVRDRLAARRSSGTPAAPPTGSPSRGHR